MTKRTLITSALPYINGIKHLGNLAGSMLPADVYARFLRARGEEVLFICATDEHGTPAELAAAAVNQDVRTYCNEQHALQKRVSEAYGLSWDWFGRSSSDQNRKLTQHFAEMLASNGFLEERVDEMIYSTVDARFLPDRYVEGTCPHCGHRPARGDQCDNCGRLLAPTDLIEPYSVISGSTNLEVRESRNLYMLLSILEPEIRSWLESKNSFSPLTRSIGFKHLDEGLRDRGITRDLTWGVPVSKNGAPWPGFENKVFYVWFDAPIEYIGATIEWSENKNADWRRWWREDHDAKEVQYVQFMGKDNVAFHTINFPGSVIGSREPWKTADVIKSFNWLTWYGGKFSTSQNRGLFMDDALDILPADYWRWYLIANSPERSDAAFTWEHFAVTVNSDLANVIGNFVSRVFKFAESRYNSIVPAGGEDGILEIELRSSIAKGVSDLTYEIDHLNMRAAAKTLREIWALGNVYFAEAAPWASIKTDPDRAAMTVRTGLRLAQLYSRISMPFIPFAATKIANALGLDKPEPWPTGEVASNLEGISEGSKITAPKPLFARLENAHIETWAARFGG